VVELPPEVAAHGATVAELAVPPCEIWTPATLQLSGICCWITSMKLMVAPGLAEAPVVAADEAGRMSMKTTDSPVLLTLKKPPVSGRGVPVAAELAELALGAELLVLVVEPLADVDAVAPVVLDVVVLPALVKNEPDQPFCDMLCWKKLWS